MALSKSVLDVYASDRKTYLVRTVSKDETICEYCN